MAMEPDEPRKKATEIVLGADLYVLSAPDLEERIAVLETEIARCRAAIQSRLSTKSAAQDFFKR